MALTINTNPSAAVATMHLSKNNAALKKSLKPAYQVGVALSNPSTMRGDLQSR